MPRGVYAVIAVGLIATLAAALLATNTASGSAAQLEYVEQATIPDSSPVPVPGGGGQMRLTEGHIRATGLNVSNYELYWVTSRLVIDAGSPVGSGRIVCTVKAPKGAEIAQSPKPLRATYPRSIDQGKLNEQPVPEVVLVRFSSHGDELATVRAGDLPRRFATEPGINLEWPNYVRGEERIKWFLPPGPPQQDLVLPFATVWKTTVPPAAKIACTLETSAGTATVRTAGALPKLSPPIDEEAEERKAEEREEAAEEEAEAAEEE